MPMWFATGTDTTCEASANSDTKSRSNLSSRSEGGFRESDSYTVADHLETARKTLAEYVSNLLAGSSSNDDNPVAVYLPNLKVVI
jgi:hypothetical protein